MLIWCSTAKEKSFLRINFLRVICWACRSTSYCLCSRVSAEMKKTMMYKADHLFSSCSTIVESQCDCLIGTGPGAHSKMCTLYLKQPLIEKRESLRETCTQVLLTFHKTECFKGSPIKTSSVTICHHPDYRMLH